MAAAPQQPRGHREEIHFAPNTAVPVALKYNAGRRVAGQSGERMMFTTPDDRIFFLSLEVAAQIEAAAINVREPFTITQHWDGGKQSPRTWSVAKLAADPPTRAGEQPNGTFAVPKLPASAAARNAAPRETAAGSGTVPSKPPATATAAQPGGVRSSDGARSPLVCEADSLVDAYAQVLERALTKYEGRVKPDEIRSLLLSAYIQRRQLSSVAA